MQSTKGSIRLFHLAGIDVFLHWSWFFVAALEISMRGRRYPSIAWNIAEYLTLFLIVTLHEFGHALACRQVGGTANRIMLWPLGGVAYVDPPPRPAATLWSIAAGPLVNVVLLGVSAALAFWGQHAGWRLAAPHAYKLLWAVCFINLGLLIFNMLPIYPLDGGQILRSLLWFVFGRARSLMVATIIGFVGIAGLIALVVGVRLLVGGPMTGGEMWLGVMAVFILLNCWGGLMQARVLSRIAKLPRRAGFACPACNQPPAIGPFWRCDKCLKPFDTFETRAVCPNCGAQFDLTRCMDCGALRPMSQWLLPSVAAP